MRHIRVSRVGVVVGYAGCVVALVWPALLNGYPILMADSWRYLGEAAGSYSWISSQFYGYFLKAFAGLSLWLAVLTQSVVAVFVVATFLRRVCRSSHVRTLVTLGLLALTSSVSLLVGVVMTDIWFGVGTLAAITLMIGNLAGKWIRVALTAVVAFAAAAHPAALPFMALMVAGYGAYVLVIRARRSRWHGLSRLAVLVIGMGAAVVLLMVNNKVLWGNASPNPHSAVVAFAYLWGHGDLDDELANCGEWKICTIALEPTPGIKAFNRFLRSRDSVLYSELGGPVEFAREAQSIVLRHIVTDPWAYIQRILATATEQVIYVNSWGHVKFMMSRLQEGHIERVDSYSARDADAFASSRQYRHELRLEGYSILTVVFGFLGALASVVLGAAWILGRVFKKDWSTGAGSWCAGVAAILLGCYVAHAVVIGMATYAAPRYGARVLWLLVLALWVIVFEVGPWALWQRSSRHQVPARGARRQP